MRDGGKGDTPRPLGVPMEVFDNAWDRIFGKKEKEESRIIEEMKETQEGLDKLK